MSSTSQLFGTYASYYNLLYRDKDYDAEVDYLVSLLSRYSSGASSLLNLGCGTGRHDLLFSQRGYKVTGVDLSREMLEIARDQAQEAKQTVDLFQGDARSIRLEKRFDAVFALFHVMSYQTANEDLLAVLRTAWNHLEAEGVFYFDCWYGPGVLSEPPTTRVKRMESETLKVTRLAESTQDPNENLVTVDYEILVERVGSQTWERIEETHRMRYLFVPEVRLLAQQSGFRLEHYETWMSGAVPQLDTWNVVFALKKVS